MTIDIRANLEHTMRATLADAANWTYDPIRPLTVPPTWKPGQEVIGDCSKGAQYVCRWSDAPDPMNNGFGPYGNSQTICVALQHLASPAELLIGDPVTFGPDGDEHATLTLEPGPDPLLWSFGHEGTQGNPCPNTYRLSQDGREAQYLRLPAPIYIPTPDDLLRAETGYWAWLQWRLGEGDWRHYKHADRTVRPDVPKKIPAAWWTRYKTFVANRKHGNAATTTGTG